jgi:hypothetical protein
LLIIPFEGKEKLAWGKVIFEKLGGENQPKGANTQGDRDEAGPFRPSSLSTWGEEERGVLEAPRPRSSAWL